MNRCVCYNASIEYKDYSSSKHFSRHKSLKGRIMMPNGFYHFGMKYKVFLENLIVQIF